MVLKQKQEVIGDEFALPLPNISRIRQEKKVSFHDYRVFLRKIPQKLAANLLTN